MDLKTLLSAARGDEPADLLLANGRLVNVYTGEIYQTDVAVKGGRIAGLGAGYHANRVIDLDGRYLCPGLINAHVHIESSMVTPAEFARAVAPRGTTTAVSDPHEIANVCGLEGIRYMLDAGENAAISIFANAPSCVPATHMSTSGAQLEAKDLEHLLGDPRVPGLAEMMNFPGVIFGSDQVLAKIEAFAGRPVDGHAPGLTGKQLNAYVAAGIGSDHECVTAEEALEKLRLGIRVLIREGTTARNLAGLLPAAMVSPSAARLCCFCTDDRHPADLLDGGDIDELVRSAISGGLDLITVIQMATLNTAEWFRLEDRGAISPGKRADLVVFSNPAFFKAEMVFVGGKLVAQDGEMIEESKLVSVDDSAVRSRVRIDLEALNLEVPAQGNKMRVIGALNDQVVTGHLVIEPSLRDGKAIADPSRDLLKMAVIERHKGAGNIGLGFVRGIGLKRGAIATTVCHDHHNLIVIGADDASMMAAVQAIVKMGGGEVVVENDRVIESLPLPIAGLMSDQPLQKVRKNQEAMLQAAASLGCSLHDPFITMSFLALEVIPALKLTDQGLVDVEKFEIVPLWID